MFFKNKKPVDPVARSARRRRLWRKAGRGALWTLLISFVLHSSLNLYASVQLNRELAALREKGEPLQLSEMKPPSVPGSENAALVYDQAIKALQLSAVEDSSIGVHSRGVKPEVEEWIESAVRKNQKVLTLTRQAAAMPECRFPLDWNGNPIQLQFNYYGDIRKLARLLASDAQIQSETGHRAVALGDVRAIFGISHHLAQEPFMIGFLVAQAVDSIGHRVLGQVLTNGPVTVPEARQILASLPTENWNSSFQHCLRGERVLGISAFASLGQLDPQNTMGMPVPPLVYKPLLFLWSPVLKLDEVQTLRLWRVLLDSPGAAQTPQPVGTNKTFEDEIQHVPRYAMLTRILFPVFSRATDQRDFAEVRRRQMEVAAALACYRTAKGHYPSTLAPAATLWGKALPTDLYSGKSFIYWPADAGFTLYSVGPNRIDDGGKDRSFQGRPNILTVDDIVWQNQGNGKLR